MKHMNKILALALALIMILGLATTASAADADLSGHTYTAYQIFKGTQAANSHKLGDVEWGDGIDGDALLAALKADDTFKDCTSAQDVAEAMTGWADKSDNAKAFARLAYAHKKGNGVECEAGTTSLDAGYYLVVDTTKFDDGADNTVYNLALLQLTQKGTFEIENKTDVPESQKKVKDTNDSVANSTTDWQDSADYDIGDDVPFQLSATLPSDLANYNKYYLAFHDVQSAGLTFNNDVVVKLNGEKIGAELYEVVSTGLADGCTFEVIIKDVKAIADVKAGDTITVEYTSKLNENAEIGSKGNPNVMHIEYSNNPNQVWNGEGKPETGETPDDKVIVFTYKVSVDKVDEAGAALEGAAFKLEKQQADGNWKEITLIVTGGTNFSAEGLDDGFYKITETQTPAGYNSVDPIFFTVAATHEEKADDPALKTLVVTVTDEQGNAVENGVSDATTGDAGYFTIDLTKGSMSTEVVNQAGTTLPETGGMGTILFYALGGLLVAAAVVLLVTKKRMASAQ